jgi:hypothetical protein
MTVFDRAVFDRYYTESQEKKLFSYVKGQKCLYAQRDYFWMRLLRVTGMRIGILGGKILKAENGRKRGAESALTQAEAGANPNVGRLLGLTVGEAKAAIMTGYLSERDDIAKRGNGGKTFMVGAATECLNVLLKIRREMGYAEADDHPLIMGKKKDGLSVRQMQDRFKYWANQVGLNGSPHWMRHTIAKRIMKNSTAQDPLGVVQGVLRQKSRNTAGIYAMPDKEDIEFHMAEVS